MGLHSYALGFDSFHVDNCRSKGDHNDSDWLTVTVTANNVAFPPQKMLIGNNLHAGDMVNNVLTTALPIDDTMFVTATLVVVNLAHSDNQDQDATAVALQVAGAVVGVVAGLDELGFAGLSPSEVETAVLGAVGSALEGIGELLGWHPSDPNCDGEVLSRVWAFPPGTLNGTPQSLGPVTETSRSPSECGQDPHSTVTYLAQPGAALEIAFPQGSVAAVSSTRRGSQVFALGPDQRVWTTFFDPTKLGPMAGGWSGWFPIGTLVFPAGTPLSVVSSVDRGTQVFAFGKDKRVWTTFFDPTNMGPIAGGWSNWFPLGDNVFPAGRVAVVSSVERGTQIFALGFDQRVWTVFFDPANLGPVAGGWSNWFPVGNGLFDPGTEVSVVTSTRRGSQLFALGEDHRVYTAFFDPANLGPVSGGWHDWFRLGDNAFPTGRIAAISSVERGTQVFALGFDQRVWTAFFDPANLGSVAGGWSTWFPVGNGLFDPGTVVSAISSVTRGSQVFALGEDHRVWTAFFDPANIGPVSGGWVDWFPLGDNTFPPCPIAVVSSVERGSQLFAMGPDQNVWTTFFDPANRGPMAGGWSNWFPLKQ
jgi:hypothetical protein